MMLQSQCFFWFECLEKSPFSMIIHHMLLATIPTIFWEWPASPGTPKPRLLGRRKNSPGCQPDGERYGDIMGIAWEYHGETCMYNTYIYIYSHYSYVDYIMLV